MPKVEDGTTDAQSVVVYGYDGADIQRIKTTTAGELVLGAGSNLIGSVDINSPVDDITEAIIMIGFPHHEVHEGDAYIVDVVDTSMANADTLVLAFKTPTAPNRMHLIVRFASKAQAHIDLIEAPTWDTGTGTATTIYNRARFSANTTEVLGDQSGAFVAGEAVANPTNLAGGTIIHDLYTWSDKKITTKDRDDNEFILKSATLYAVRLTADTATNAGQIILSYYEHSDSN